MRSPTFVALLLAAAPAAAARPDWADAQRITVAMTDHGFVPRLVNLRHGHAYAIRFVNRSGRGHDFQAARFFRAATLDPRSRHLIRDAKIDLDPGQSATVRLVAPQGPGRFPFRSARLSDALSGASGYVLIR